MSFKIKITGIVSFISNNKLDFTGSGSALNSACTVLSGYALHIGITSSFDLFSILKEEKIPGSSAATDELERVFNYAKANNYGLWWSSQEAHKQYKF